MYKTQYVGVIIFIYITLPSSHETVLIGTYGLKLEFITSLDAILQNQLNFLWYGETETTFFCSKHTFYVFKTYG